MLQCLLQACIFFGKELRYLKATGGRCKQLAGVLRFFNTNSRGPKICVLAITDLSWSTFYLVLNLDILNILQKYKYETLSYIQYIIQGYSGKSINK